MTNPLRHSHIAIRTTLPVLAKAAHARIRNGEDDIGIFRFFDLVMDGDGRGGQRVRFASHEGDAMVHLLAERIEDLATLVAALAQVGLNDRSELSISRDQHDRPLRDIVALQAGLTQLAHSTPAPTLPFAAR